MTDKSIWLTWENHRRSRELSEAFGAEYLPIILDRSRYVRYPVLALLTLWKIILKRPRLVFCQNPSIVLSAFLVALKTVFRFRLVIDRHSNFKFEHQSSKNLKWKIFWCLSRFTVRGADVTIVTNEPLRKICNQWGGNTVVLPDKLPDMRVFDNKESLIIKDANKINAMAVTTFDSDEPIDDIIEAASLLSDDFQIYLTGKNHKYVIDKGRNWTPPVNIVFTGFISESAYRALMNSADIILVLTTKDLILNCGAYEAVSANKPLILSNTEILQNYFNRGVIFVDINPESIAAGITEASRKIEYLTDELKELRVKLEESWSEQFQAAERAIMLNNSN